MSGTWKLRILIAALVAITVFGVWGMFHTLFTEGWVALLKLLVVGAIGSILVEILYEKPSRRR